MTFDDLNQTATQANKLLQQFAYMQLQRHGDHCLCETCEDSRAIIAGDYSRFDL